jgi:hypothetical protein
VTGHPLDVAEAGELGTDRQRDTETGRFEATPAEPLTGLAGVEAESGFERMPEEPDADRGTFNSDAGGLEATARELSDRRNDVPSEAPELPPVVRREYHDSEGRPIDQNKTISAERAAKDLTAIREQDRAQAQLAVDQEAARELGLEVFPKADGTLAEEPGAQQPQPREQTAQPGEIDPQLQAALEHPQVREALQREFQAVEHARAQYAAGLAQTTSIGVAAILSEFPELAQASQQDLPRAFAQMKASDPARAERASAAVQRVTALAAEHQRFQAHRIAEHQTQRATVWNHYTKNHDDQFEALAAKEVSEWKDPAFRQRVTAEIYEGAKELGVSPEQLTAAYNSDPTMRSAAFQKMLLDAARFRMAQKGVRNATRNPVGPVHKPGMATEQSRVPYAIQQATEEFNRDPNPKTGAALRVAHLKNNRSRTRGPGLV